MDIGKLIGHLITVSIVLSTFGLLAKVTNLIRTKVNETQLRGTVPLGGFNRRLHLGK